MLELLAMIPDSVGWALVGAFITIDVVGVIHTIKMIAKARKEAKEEE